VSDLFLINGLIKGFSTVSRNFHRSGFVRPSRFAGNIGGSHGAKMTHVTPVQVDEERWLRHSVRVYLEGEKNFQWISEAVRGSEKATAMVLLTTFGRFSQTARYRKLLESVRDSVRDTAPERVWILHSSQT